MTSQRHPQTRPMLALAAVLVVGGALRLAAVLTVGDVPKLHGDERYYVIRTATPLAHGSVFPNTMRPPAFPFFVALLFRTFGERMVCVRFAQILLSLLTIVIVFFSVRRRFGENAALVSAVFCAGSPELVHYTHFLWSETLLATLLVLSVWLLDLTDTTGRVALALAAGVALGVAILTREMLLYFVPIAAVWLARPEGGLVALRRLAPVLFVVATAAVVVPWTIRNIWLHHRLIVVSTLHWYPIAEGNLLVPGTSSLDDQRADELRDRYLGNPNELEREAMARGVAIRAISDEQPLWIAKKLVITVRGLLGTKSQLSRFLDRGWLRPADAPLVRALLPWKRP